MDRELVKSPFELIYTREQFIRNFIASLEIMPASVMLSYWQSYIAINSSTDYKEEVSYLIVNNIIPTKEFMVGDLRSVHLQNINHLQSISGLSDVQRKRLLDCYKVFCAWLEHISFGWFRAQDRRNFELTCFEVWRTFIETLYEINTRDELIARALLQGQKRVSTILSLKLEQINFDENSITFLSKPKLEKVIYHRYFMDDLKAYIAATQSIRQEPFVFITRTGQPVTRARLNYSFEQVGKMVPSIRNKITPDSLRHLWQQLRQDGYEEGIIMRNKQARVNENMKLEKEFLNQLEVSL
jgi:hypothetical protein